ncbi:MAG: signal peptidase II [bacterium]
MNNNKKIRGMIFCLSGFFLLLDQFLKWQATHSWIQAKLLHNYFGWQPFLNQGAAFGLPLPSWLIVLLTIPVVVVIGFLISQQYQNAWQLTAWVLLLTGAISNLFDRIFYEHVIDYFAFVTGIINLADVLIVIGLLIYLFKNTCKRNI